MRHDRRVPVPRPAPPAPEPRPADGGQPPTRCPGCGSVLAPLPDQEPGGSAACGRLFEETTRGLREEAASDPRAAATVALADDAYAAQHPDPDAPDRLRQALERLAARFGTDGGTAAPRPPRVWQTTVADVAADLDVVDLPALVESWARSVGEDWARATRT